MDCGHKSGKLDLGTIEPIENQQAVLIDEVTEAWAQMMDAFFEVKRV